jgi:threonine dehydrogenase-like Zn-dependent dehydrogenase
VKAVVWHAVGDIRIDNVPKPTDAVEGENPLTAESFPIGNATNKNLTVKMGDGHHRRYIAKLVRLAASGAIDPTRILTQRAPLTSAMEAYKQFDLRHSGWTKVKLEPAA